MMLNMWGVSSLLYYVSGNLTQPNSFGGACATDGTLIVGEMPLLFQTRFY